MKKQRLFGIDFLRLTAMIAIVHFHQHEVFYYADDSHLDGVGLIDDFMRHYAQFMAFSGFTIIMLSFFLFGLKGISAEKWKKLFLICIGGTVALFFAHFDGNLTLEWDIYTYVIGSILLIGGIRKYKKVVYSLAVFLFVLLWLPRDYFMFPQFQGLWVYNMLLGDYYTLGRGSWPLFPWVGIALIPYAIGAWLRDTNYVEALKKINLKEKIIWLVLALITLPQIGAFYPIPIGPNFYKFMFNQTSLVLWSHLFWVILIIRLSFLPKPNEFLNKHWLTSWVGKLQLNKSFFLFYIAHLLVLAFYSNFSETLGGNALLTDLNLLSIIPLSEIMVIYFLKLNRYIGAKKAS